MFRSVIQNIVVKIKCAWNWITLGLGVSYGIWDNVIVKFFVRIDCSSWKGLLSFVQRVRERILVCLLLSNKSIRFVKFKTKIYYLKILNEIT